MLLFNERAPQIGLKIVQKRMKNLLFYSYFLKSNWFQNGVKVALRDVYRLTKIPHEKSFGRDYTT